MISKVTATDLGQIVNLLQKQLMPEETSPKTSPQETVSKETILRPLPLVDTKLAYDIIIGLETGGKYAVGDLETGYGLVGNQLSAFSRHLSKDPLSEKVTGISSSDYKTIGSAHGNACRALRKIDYWKEVPIDQDAVESYFKNNPRKYRRKVLKYTLPNGEAIIAKKKDGGWKGYGVDYSKLSGYMKITPESKSKINRIVSRYITGNVNLSAIAKLKASQDHPELYKKFDDTFTDAKKVRKNKSLMALCERMAQRDFSGRINSVVKMVQKYGYDVSNSQAYNIYQLIAIANASGLGRLSRFLKNKQTFSEGHLYYLKRANPAIQKKTGISTQMPPNGGLAGFKQKTAMISKRAIMKSIPFPQDYVESIKNGQRTFTIRLEDYGVEPGDTVQAITDAGAHFCDLSIEEVKKMTPYKIGKDISEPLGLDLEEKFKFQPEVENFFVIKFYNPNIKYASDNKHIVVDDGAEFLINALHILDSSFSNWEKYMDFEYDIIENFSLYRVKFIIILDDLPNNFINLSPLFRQDIFSRTTHEDHYIQVSSYIRQGETEKFSEIVDILYNIIEKSISNQKTIIQKFIKTIASIISDNDYHKDDVYSVVDPFSVFNRSKIIVPKSSFVFKLSEFNLLPQEREVFNLHLGEEKSKETDFKIYSNNGKSIFIISLEYPDVKYIDEKKQKENVLGQKKKNKLIGLNTEMMDHIIKVMGNKIKSFNNDGVKPGFVTKVSELYHDPFGASGKFFNQDIEILFRLEDNQKAAYEGLYNSKKKTISIWIPEENIDYEKIESLLEHELAHSGEVVSGDPSASKYIGPDRNFMAYLHNKNEINARWGQILLSLRRDGLSKHHLDLFMRERERMTEKEEEIFMEQVRGRVEKNARTILEAINEGHNSVDMIYKVLNGRFTKRAIETYIDHLRGDGFLSNASRLDKIKKLATQTYSDRNDNTYNVDELIKITKDNKITDEPIKKFKKNLKKKMWEDSDDNEISLQDVLDNKSKYRKESSRIKEVDLKYPILVYKDTVVDGNHRLSKAFDEEKETIKVRYVTNKQMEKCLEKEIDFPKSEHKDIKKQLKERGHIYTTRVDKDYGKYKEGDILTSPFGTLRVKDVDKYNKLEDHPHLDELTDKNKEDIGKHKYEYIKLIRKESERMRLISKVAEDISKKDDIEKIIDDLNPDIVIDADIVNDIILELSFESDYKDFIDLSDVVTGLNNNEASVMVKEHKAIVSLIGRNGFSPDLIRKAAANINSAFKKSKLNQEAIMVKIWAKVFGSVSFGYGVKDEHYSFKLSSGPFRRSLKILFPENPTTLSLSELNVDDSKKREFGEHISKILGYGIVFKNFRISIEGDYVILLCVPDMKSSNYISLREQRKNILEQKEKNLSDIGMNEDKFNELLERTKAYYNSFEYDEYTAEPIDEDHPSTPLEKIWSDPYGAAGKFFNKNTKIVLAFHERTKNNGKYSGKYLPDENLIVAYISENDHVDLAMIESIIEHELVHSGQGDFSGYISSEENSLIYLLNKSEIDARWGEILFSLRKHGPSPIYYGLVSDERKRMTNQEKDVFDECIKKIRSKYQNIILETINEGHNSIDMAYEALERKFSKKAIMKYFDELEFNHLIDTASRLDHIKKLAFGGKDQKILYHVGPRPAEPKPYKHNIEKGWTRYFKEDGEHKVINYERAVFLTNNWKKVWQNHGIHGNIYIYKIPMAMIKESGGIQKYDWATEIIFDENLWNKYKKDVVFVGSIDEQKAEEIMKDYFETRPGIGKKQLEREMEDVVDRLLSGEANIESYSYFSNDRLNTIKDMLNKKNAGEEIVSLIDRILRVNAIYQNIDDREASRIDRIKKIANFPNELLEKLDDINYGLVTTDDEELSQEKMDSLDDENVDWWKNGDNIKLLTTEETLDRNIGSCYEQSLLEYKLLDEAGYDPIMVFVNPEDGEGNGHSAIFYSEGDEWYWIEHSWGDQRGIHGPYDNINDGIDIMIEKMSMGWKNVTKYYLNKDMDPSLILDKEGLTYKDFKTQGLKGASIENVEEYCNDAKVGSRLDLIKKVARRISILYLQKKYKHVYKHIADELISVGRSSNNSKFFDNDDDALAALSRPPEIIRRYLNDKLPKDVIVEVYDDGMEDTFYLGPRGGYLEKPISGRWIHVSCLPRGKNLDNYLRKFLNIDNHVCFSSVGNQSGDELYVEGRTDQFFAIIMDGEADGAFGHDVYSDIDEWTNRRCISGLTKNKRKPPETIFEAWVIPKQSKFVCIVSNIDSIIKEAEELGINIVKSSPIGFGRSDNEIDKTDLTYEDSVELENELEETDKWMDKAQEYDSDYYRKPKKNKSIVEEDEEDSWEDYVEISGSRFDQINKLAVSPEKPSGILTPPEDKVKMVSDYIRKHFYPALFSHWGNWKEKSNFILKELNDAKKQLEQDKNALPSIWIKREKTNLTIDKKETSWSLFGNGKFLDIKFLSAGNIDFKEKIIDIIDKEEKSLREDFEWAGKVPQEKIDILKEYANGQTITLPNTKDFNFEIDNYPIMIRVVFDPTARTHYHSRDFVGYIILGSHSFSPYQTNQQYFFEALRAIPHEFTHVMQDILAKKLGKERHEVGLSSSRIGDKPEHHLKPHEFKTNLVTTIEDIKQNLLQYPSDERGEILKMRLAVIPSENNYGPWNLTHDRTMVLLKKDAPIKWKKAVKEVYQAVENLLQDKVAQRLNQIRKLAQRSKYEILIGYLINILNDMNVSKSEVIIGGSGILGALGLKSVGDLDITIPDKKAWRRISQHPNGIVDEIRPGNPRVRFDFPEGELEIFTGPWKVDERDFAENMLLTDVEGISHWSPEHTLEWKQMMNRPKDQSDIELLEGLNKKSSRLDKLANEITYLNQKEQEENVLYDKKMKRNVGLNEKYISSLINGTKSFYKNINEEYKKLGIDEYNPKSTYDISSSHPYLYVGDIYFDPYGTSTKFSDPTLKLYFIKLDPMAVSKIWGNMPRVGYGGICGGDKILVMIPDFDNVDLSKIESTLEHESTHGGLISYPKYTSIEDGEEKYMRQHIEVDARWAELLRILRRYGPGDYLTKIKNLELATLIDVDDKKKYNEQFNNIVNKYADIILNTINEGYNSPEMVYKVLDRKFTLEAIKKYFDYLKEKGLMSYASRFDKIYKLAGIRENLIKKYPDLKKYILEVAHKIDKRYLTWFTKQLVNFENKQSGAVRLYDYITEFKNHQQLLENKDLYQYNFQSLQKAISEIKKQKHEAREVAKQYFELLKQKREEYRNLNMDRKKVRAKSYEDGRKFLNNIEPKSFQSFVRQEISKVIEEREKAKGTEKTARENSDIIFEDENYLVVLPGTIQASKYFGSGTQWCTSGEENNMFVTYSSKNIYLYYIINKENDDKYAYVAVKKGSNINVDIRDIKDVKIDEATLSEALGEYYDKIVPAIKQDNKGREETKFEELLKTMSPEELKQNLDSKKNKIDILIKILEKTERDDTKQFADKELRPIAEKWAESESESENVNFFDYKLYKTYPELGEVAAEKLAKSDGHSFFLYGLHYIYPEYINPELGRMLAEKWAKEGNVDFWNHDLHKTYPELGRMLAEKWAKEGNIDFFRFGLENDYLELAKELTAKLAIEELDPDGLDPDGLDLSESGIMYTDSVYLHNLYFKIQQDALSNNSYGDNYYKLKWNQGKSDKTASRFDSINKIANQLSY